MLGNNGTIVDGIKSQIEHIPDIPSYIIKQYNDRFNRQSFFQKHPIITGIGAISLFAYGVTRLISGNKTD
jgi:hypothetical protein